MAKTKPSSTQTQQAARTDQARVSETVQRPEAESQVEQQALQPTAPGAQRAVTVPAHYPKWPTSRPGPRATPPPPGMRPVNPFRPEQLVEIGYNQETGEPGIDSPLRSMPDENIVGRGQTSFDQPRTAQEELGKRKKRL